MPDVHAPSTRRRTAGTLASRAAHPCSSRARWSAAGHAGRRPAPRSTGPAAPPWSAGGRGVGCGGGGAGTSSALVHRKTCRLGSASADSQGWRPLLERNRTYSCTRRHQCQLDAPTRLQGPAPPCAHLDGVHSVGGAVQPPVQPEDEEPGIEGSERKAHQRHGRLGPHHALHRRAGRQVGPVPRQISCGVHRVHTRTLAAQPALRGLVPERVPAPSTTPRHPGASRCCRPGQRLVQACLRGYGCRATAAPGPAGSACWTQKRPAPGARGW